MLPKTKTRANSAIYCFSMNTYTTIRENESRLRKTGALSQSLQKMFKKLSYCQKPWKTTVKELLHVSSNVFCTFNLTFLTVNTLRGVSDSFVKQETPVPSSTSPASLDSD